MDHHPPPLDTLDRSQLCMSPTSEEVTMSPVVDDHAGGGLFRLGICCMEKKQTSKPMKEFLNRIKSSGRFEIVCFSEDMILNAPVDKWPKVDCCIPFFSNGFPLEKAVEYAHNHHDTFFLTEPKEQKVLLDRRAVYHALVRNNIPVVRHVVCSRDGYSGETEPVIVEEDNYIEVNGVRIDKPFVEKPVNSEDHNIRIYYRDQQGSRHLFRKVGNKSSEFHPEVNKIRREGSYIYEEFVETSAAEDVKVYTVGVDYAHAECRKSPVVDGEVQRDANGKEIRKTTPLNEYERQIARKIVKVFRQRVCGFDVLRTEGKSFVCDVNGWSFVKGNSSYYDAASSIICEIFLEEMRKRGLSRMTHDRKGERELRAVIALFRHGDRTPKQKIKLKTKAPIVLRKAFGSVPGKQAELVIKGTDIPSAPIISWRGTFSDILDSDSLDKEVREKYEHMVTVMAREAEGLKLQIKPQGYDADGLVDQAQVILKWGGWLTDAGRMQARNLGGSFNRRVLRGAEVPHVIDVFSNNERRVRNTAIEFAGTCAATDWNEFMVNPGPRGKEICKALDHTENAKKSIEASKVLIDKVMNMDCEEEVAKYKHLPGLEAILQLKKTPKRAMRHCHQLIEEVIRHIPEERSLHRGEPCSLVRQRWTKLAEGFHNEKTGVFDTTKISDIFDYISYDVSYNQEALFPLDLYPLFELAQVLNNFVGIGEYGLTPKSRLLIGSQIVAPLLKEWMHDLREFQEADEPRTRLYFSSESHITALYNVLYHSEASSRFHVVADPIELHYLSHIVMKVYKYRGMDRCEKTTYQMEVLFSQGIDTNAFGIFKDHHVSSLTPMIRIHNNLHYNEFENIVEKAVTIAENPQEDLDLDQDIIATSSDSPLFHHTTNLS